MLSIDRFHRPLSGEILWLGALLSGESPLGWQSLNLFYRWLSSVVLFWALLKIWPDQYQRLAGIAFIFLVFPGFTQQFVSINTSRHLLPLIFLFLSVGFMAWAIRWEKRRVTLTFASLFLAVLEVLSSDYYLGLELIRPLIIWLCLSPAEESPQARLKSTLKLSLPYLVFIALALGWRYSISRYANYPVTLMDQVSYSPVQALVGLGNTILQYIWTVCISAWAKIFTFPAREAFGIQTIALYTLVVLLAFALTFWYLLRLRDDVKAEKFWLEAITLGLFSLLAGGLPFLSTGLTIDLTFPNDRGILALMFGASLFWVGLLDRLLVNRTLKLVFLSMMIGLAAGSHLLLAYSYQKDWKTQTAFFEQLTWRVPGLENRTALLYSYTIALHDFHSTDNSLTAPLNWIYAPSRQDNELTYMLFDLRLRKERILPGINSGQPITAQYGDFSFQGSSDKILVIAYDPPACLRVLHPIYDRLDPRLSDDIAEVLPLTNLDLIEGSSMAKLPEHIFGSHSEGDSDWCFLFEKADLARQQEDWQKVVQIGNQVSEWENAPRHASELVPFIQGYAIDENWIKAEQLTQLALGVSQRMEPMLCSIWVDLVQRTSSSDDRSMVADRLQKELQCDFYP